MNCRLRKLVRWVLFTVVVALLVAAPEAAYARSIDPPIHVVLWFDTEDYILPQSDGAAKRVAEMLTRLGIKATFKLVGEKARVLEQRKRRDVIDALLKHEIGYHSDTHSQQPTIAVYLQRAGWEDGAAEFERREGPGVKDIQRIFGVTPTCYGQPGSSWAPQAYPALKRLGIPVYLDESNHVGIDDQPFYYCGMLNIFKMRSTVARMELEGETNLAQGKEKFLRAYHNLRVRGGGTISIYYHPAEFVHREFWDAVNFSRGSNPPRERWRLPAAKSEDAIEKAFGDFEQYVSFIKAQPGVRYVTASGLSDLYPDHSPAKNFSRSEVRQLAESVQKEISFQTLNGVTLSAAELFSLLTNVMTSYLGNKELPAAARLMTLYGPTRPFASAAAKKRVSSIPWYAFARAVRDVEAYCRQHGRIPDEIWIGVESISPEDYLATLAFVVKALMTGGGQPDEVIVRDGKLTAEKYVAEDSPKLWGWVIFPEGFHAPKIMELARLQAWTLKPALLAAAEGQGNYRARREGYDAVNQAP